ncbi:MAG: hypothetical protein ACRDGA_13940, partial [Bacteroidota bacterium]
MKRILLMSAVGFVTLQSAFAQQVSSKTMPSMVSVVVESPVDTAQLQPYLQIIREQPGSLQAAEAHLTIARMQYNTRAY